MSDKDKITLPALMEEFQESNDFHLQPVKIGGQPFQLFYMTTLADQSVITKDILPSLRQVLTPDLEDIQRELPFINTVITTDGSVIEENILRGYLGLNHSGADECLMIPAKEEKIRDITVPEVEFSVIGPKQAFIEDIQTNIQLIRRRLPVKELKMIELEVGSLSKAKVAIIYLKDIANEENVNTMKQRISDIDFDHIDDSSYINQMIEDNSMSPFPQLIDTERPDRVAASLSEGKVAVLVDGSPTAITGPTTFIEFFSAFDDYFSSWHISSVVRVIRLLSVAFSIFATAIYVAVLTYHSQLIPKDLLSTLIQSRQAIPFPPIIEALFLELTIELLREAGARLPTKVGQTIGIVGGIVIGTAAVEAGLTSNVLLIIVALSALASFTTPIYRIGNTIRVLRFPFLIVAQLWGLIGIFIGIGVLLVHLIGLTSLGRPYLEPIFPPRVADFKDSIIRLPFSMQSTRPSLMRTPRSKRFKKEEAEKKKDIDE
ncbi:spore germination protein [Salipaludibacillus keqinensis]|uniref:Spore germination protein n=1 Tax=Salipaludibacillus keqinensis TaxID=2045207 RepID=A0A323TIL4_9BACI|nr:spore germination protein [Salipaludibacillus keqinensis]PYZ94658.1 spore germination protein [Salipaludibacillus keqinensis]